MHALSYLSYEGEREGGEGEEKLKREEGKQREETVDRAEGEKRKQKRRKTKRRDGRSSRGGKEKAKEAENKGGKFNEFSKEFVGCLTLIPCQCSVEGLETDCGRRTDTIHTHYVVYNI